jgi:hypothetical protein
MGRASVSVDLVLLGDLPLESPFLDPAEHHDRYHREHLSCHDHWYRNLLMYPVPSKLSEVSEAISNVPAADESHPKIYPPHLGVG